MKEVGPHSTRSCNANVNGGPTMGGGSPKETHMGMGMGMKDTNVKEKLSCNPPEISPSATSQSKNRHKGKGPY